MIMKAIRPSSISAAMSAIALSFITVPFVSAQSYPDQDKDSSKTNRNHTAMTPTDAVHPSDDMAAAKNFRLEQRSDAIIGREIYSAERKEIGEVNDLVVDAHSGRIVFAIVESGGVLGIGDKERAVPFSALSRTRMEDKDAFSIGLNEAGWKAAPTLDRDEIATLDNSRRDSLFAYYGASSDYLREGAVTLNRQPVASARQTGQINQIASNTAPEKSQGQLLRVSELTGKDLRSGDAEVGEIEDVLVNIDRRKASLLLDPEDAFAGTNDKLVVAFSRLTLTPSDRGIDHINTDLQPNDLKNARHREVTASDWLENDTGTPYVWTDGTLGTVPYTAFAPERDQMTEHDKQVSADTVRDALEDDPAIGDAMDKIQVERSGNSLVLSGEVATMDMKNRITRAAKIHAGNWPVQDRIVVKRTD